MTAHATATISRRSATAPAIELSPAERAQLGTVRLRKNGAPSTHPYPTAQDWLAIRAHMVARSRHSNPLLDESLTAYTPGETVALLQHPTVAAWLDRVASLRLPQQYDRVVLVPCAKTKPWTGPAVSRSRLYSAYNTLREEHPTTAFATVSEPLGIVPMSDWADFPQYDNPGLFRDDSQRSGMTTQQWVASPLGRCYGTPFDEDARRQCIERLGTVVGSFLAQNNDRELISVVDNLDGSASTHGEMLDVALERNPDVHVARSPKRAAPRIDPLPYLRGLLERK